MTRMANSPTRGFFFPGRHGKIIHRNARLRHSGMRASLSVAPARVGSLGRAPSRHAAARGLGGRRRAAGVTAGARSVPVAEPPVGPSSADRNDDRVGSSDVTRRAASVAASSLAVCAMAFATATTSAAHAFVPVVGCGDPGSPYDTGVERVEPSRDTGAPAKTKTANCVSLYQPAHDAERRAAERASLRAGEKSAVDGAYGGTE